MYFTFWFVGWFLQFICSFSTFSTYSPPFSLRLSAYHSSLVFFLSLPNHWILKNKFLPFYGKLCNLECFNNDLTLLSIFVFKFSEGSLRWSDSFSMLVKTFLVNIVNLSFWKNDCFSHFDSYLVISFFCSKFC